MPADFPELVGIGLNPYQALLTFTTHPFEFLGELDDSGTVRVEATGKVRIIVADQKVFLQVDHPNLSPLSCC